jgi:hypothetical protein
MGADSSKQNVVTKRKAKTDAYQIKPVNWGTDQRHSSEEEDSQ